MQSCCNLVTQYPAPLQDDLSVLRRVSVARTGSVFNFIGFDLIRVSQLVGPGLPD